MKTERRQIGDWGESLARKHLEAKGYIYHASNYINPRGMALGEIDIILYDATKECYVFVEVKTKTIEHLVGDSVPFPFEQITHHKLKRLTKIATYYLQNQGQAAAQYRFDGVFIVHVTTTNQAYIKHVPHLF